MTNERPRRSRGTSSRHSSLLAGGRGEPRDSRREGQRLTDKDLDPDHFEIVDGKITLKEQPAAASAAMAPLADNSGGAKSRQGIAVVPDPGSAPATATVLRDDLVANTLPALRNAIATLAARLNQLTG